MDIEFKKMIGTRYANSDGFTYSYGGRVPKDGPGCHRRTKNVVARCKRNDKRSCNTAAMKRVFKEMEG